jgi:endonuclease/exonuclease/phosphatase family metal-dependent hydrolase
MSLKLFTTEREKKSRGLILVEIKRLFLSASMSTFRVATLNVHSFRKSSTYANNISDLVSILEPLNLDLIAVQEIQNNNEWSQFTTGLSFQHWIYGECNRDYFGNGIASRYPIASAFHIANNSSWDEVRCLLQCSLESDNPFIQNKLFAVTHLDHLNEDDRLKQIKQFDPYKQNVDILMGDMNALTREDYSDHYFQKRVIETRQASFWEKPRFDLTTLIKDE